VSYILDALKKSENERDREQGGIPDIQSVHNPVTGEAQQSSHLWPYVAIFTSVIVIVAVTFMWIPSESVDLAQENELPDQNILAQLNDASASNDASKQSVIDKPRKTPKQDKSSDQKHTPKPPVRSKPKPKAQVIFATEPLDTMPESKPGQNNRTIKRNFNSDKVYKVAELPLSVRRNVPPITFTGHVYSSTPASRSVMINDAKMREGQPVTSQLILHEITQYGAVFKFNGYFFSLSALQDWKFR